MINKEGKHNLLRLLQLVH